METEMSTPVKRRRASRPQGAQECQGAAREEPVPLSERLTNGLVKIIALEDIKDIPKEYGNVLIALFFVGLLCVFLYFLVTDYHDNRRERFLSLESSAGECEAVLRPMDGVYMIDTNGYWQGETYFDYAKGIYSLSFNNFLGSEEDFAELITAGYEEIQKIGAVAVNSSLAVNLLYWMVFSASAVWGNSVQQIQLTGSPEMVFDRRYKVASLSNDKGVCDVGSKTTFDKHNGVLTTRFNYEEFQSSETCTGIVNATHLGYLPLFDGDELRMDIDVRSLVTGAAVNMGILSPYELQVIPHTSGTVTVHGVSYDIDKFYNPRYPGMDPLYCQRNKEMELLSYDVPYTCVLAIGAIYMYPTFNHVGSNATKPSYCECGELDVKSRFYCNEFNLLPSLVFYDFNNSYYNESEHDLVHFSFLNGVTGVENNRNAYEAAYDAVVPTDLRNNTEWRQSAYKFCSENTTSGCSMFTILLSDYSNAVSDYYYQVLDGGCNDSFTISDESINRAKRNPPVSVEERYYECQKSKGDALYEAFGIAVGNLLLTRFVLLGLYLGLLSLFRSISKKVSFPETYTFSERNKVLNFFAFQLLLARDGKYRTAQDGSVSVVSGIDKSDAEEKKSVIMQLHAELAAISKTDKFFPMVSTKHEGEITSSSPLHLEEQGVTRNTSGSSVSRASSRLDLSRKWAEENIFVEILDNPLDPKKSMKRL